MIDHLVFPGWVEPSNRRHMRDNIDDAISELQHLATSPAS